MMDVNRAILDASAFYAGIPFGSLEPYCTTPQVYDEISHIKKEQNAISTLMDLGRLVIYSPDDTYTQQVLDLAQETGDVPQLSDADVSVIALALQNRQGIITDDYAVSNTARHLGLSVSPVMTKGIRTVGRWMYRCAACRMQRPPGQNCNICGSVLRRRLVRRN
ncbi:MAG: nucleotide-binding protein [Cenarchaeum sp. SB0665_bin_23]|nr:nucleotide-binding protein [Cenarchaeum sp. SB0664_bin_35]MXY61736.1 nucleotide-binding protein [Cenarchaeum sp. SB0665_bin_23]MXZ93519.1 nucleotide-binding protein [Cenarchaeum sp. SB0666_bin_15]MYB46703.1 nucleotide-binding protein [Cenarchaeum sp. SB0662_bin_33]MYD59272.1 nucleotide-binding protein [Cenarchaeum sp. SB0678_bin_8]MYG33628.1 nucleotide-binding protein [Cenarchaeum sp. SB0677_bin_16]MYJ28129.1 nucleotide-binding protein [Cenarchaeum sp. SB0672_bin_9]